MNPRLSKKHAKVLFFLLDFQKEKRYAPIVSEIADHLGSGYGAAMSCVLALEKKITSRSCGTRRVASAGLMCCGSRELRGCDE